MMSFIGVAPLVIFLPIFIVSANMDSYFRPPYPYNKPNSQYPSRLKIINNYEGPVKPQYEFVEHLANPMVPAVHGSPQYNPYNPQVLGDPVDCVCPCTREYLPICGTDGKTYGNNCLFQCQRKCDPSLRLKYCGTCDEPREDLKLPCF